MKKAIHSGHLHLPDMTGEVVRETPKMIFVRVTGYTFKAKESCCFTHRFTADDRKYFLSKLKEERIMRFWKDYGYEVGGTYCINVH